MATEAVLLETSDGLRLEGELDVPVDCWAGAVLAHPHPQFGGTMRSIVISVLFEALPPAGVAALRFNFRGVGRSEGAFDDGRGERHDVVAALDALHGVLEGLPLVLAGWSFGADTSLAVDDGRSAGWFAVAAPMPRPEELVAAQDPRPKLLVVPEHDEYRSPESARGVTATWPNTRLVVVPGADHFLIGRTDRLPPLLLEWLREISFAERTS